MGPFNSKSKHIGNRYAVKSYIGAGGMQDVYLAHDELLKRDVALKTPKDGSNQKRFQKSALVSAKINQSNVAKTLDYLTDVNGRDCLIEEFVVGADLKSVLVNNKLPCLPPSTCARLLHQLSKGLAASHQAGVVHRDLKPSNIMISAGIKFDSAKITDFGIAKMAEEEIGAWADTQGTTSSKTVLGAIPYMSPESISDFKKATLPSDVWAIGAIIYELMSGELPFGNGLKSIPKILEAKPPSKPTYISAPQFKELGEQVFELLLGCMKKKPEDRPTANELAISCGQLCYSQEVYELGRISQNHVNGVSFGGFIQPENGNGLFYHKSSFYGVAKNQAGQRVWYARAQGTGNDRAFPVVCLD
jgi:eukaryotic-like serine/threonine-protein kinase